MTSGSGLGDVQHWLARQDEDVTVELVCAEHPGPFDSAPDRTLVRLTSCAAELEVHELVELLTVGTARVVVQLDGCEHPAAARRQLAPTVALLVAGLVDRLSVVGVDVPPAPVVRGRRRGRPVEVLDAGAMPVSRRGLFGLAGPSGHELPPPTAGPRARYIAAVRALVTPTAALGSAPGPTRALQAGGCVACGVCVQACPATALRLVDGPVGAGVSISTLLLDPAACTGCAGCVDLCPSHVLAEAAPVRWDVLLAGAEVPVVTVTTALCARCSVRFPISSGERLCPVCSYRRRNPFGSTLAPGSGARA